MINLYDEQEKLIGSSLLVVDVVIFALAFKAAGFFIEKFYQDRILEITDHTKLPTIILSAILIYLASFIFFGFYRTFRHQVFSEVLSKTFVGVLFGTMGVITLFFIIDVHIVNRSIFGFFSLSILGLLAVSRSAAYFLLRQYRKKGFNYKNVLIIGSKVRAREMIEAIVKNPGAGYRVLGCLELDDSFVGQTVAHNIKVIGTIKGDYRNIIMNQEIDELIFAIPLDQVENGTEYVSLAEEIGVNLRVLPDWQIHKMTYHPGTASIYYDHFLGLPTLALSSIPQKETELFLKGVIDYVGATFLLVLTSPVLILAAIAIKLSSPGPILFKQTRSGLNGRRFTVLKFRSMVAGADAMKEELKYFNEEDGPAFKIRDDPRLSPIGKFLRMTSIDEFPQLINIMKGDMSLVGPRPPIPEEVALYKPWHRRRLSLKPGLTCIWQVTARNKTDFDTWMKLDLEYIDNWSIFLDFQLLLRTIPALLFATGR